jgi:hypothetical protein
MREKLLKYSPPHPKGVWPFCSNILDVIRCAIICPDAVTMLQVIAQIGTCILEPEPCALRVDMSSLAVGCRFSTEELYSLIII